MKFRSNFFHHSTRPPQLTIRQGTNVINDQKVDFTLGESIQFSLTGVDGDVSPAKDILSLTLIEASGKVEPEGYLFTPMQGMSPLQTTFSWST
ncbi:MAG: hypothetical protein U5K54_21550 [Cytophagales bacterium]|nr:hypothetical protein [Cytophagales bacterium]